MQLDKKIRNKLKFDVPVKALEKWDRSIHAKDDDKEHSINIYSTVGDYGDGQGMTAKIVSAILRKAEGADVTVNINSGGGDFFEGLAIYSLLSEYEGKVNVKVLGLAASAASIIAMAGDNVEISKAGFIMIHNSWTLAIGNKNDMKEAAKLLGQFDDSMAKLYAEHTKIEEKDIAKMMNDETWLMGETAVELNFASALLGDDEVEKDEEDEVVSALRKLDVALAKGGMSRSERRSLLKEVTHKDVDTPCAVETVKPCADAGLLEALSGVLNNLNKENVK